MTAPKPEPKKSPCRSGCKTQDHASWGECIRAANVGIDKSSLK